MLYFLSKISCSQYIDAHFDSKFGHILLYKKCSSTKCMLSLSC